MMRSKLLLFITSLCLFGAINVSYAADRSAIGLNELDGLSLTVGVDYQSGNYGTPYTTKLWSVPVGLDYTRGPLSAGVSTAYLNADSTGTIIIGGMSHMTSVSKSTTAKSASGIGDVNMYARYELTTLSASQIGYHVTGRVKLGTADENKGLGTGANDFAVEAGLSTIHDKFLVFASLGYQITGDSSSVNYDNILYASAGSTYIMDDINSLGTMLEVSQAATPGFDSPAQLTVFYNREINKQRDLYFYVLLGLSNGSPDNGAGLHLTMKL